METLGATEHDPQRLDERLLEALRGHPFWDRYLSDRIAAEWRGSRLHVAVFVEPFLTYVLEGRKTIESRFSARRVAPFDKVATGDVIALKDSGGPLVGICRVDACWFYRMSAKSWAEVEKRFSRAMCAEDPMFWDDRRGKTFATLIRVSEPTSIRPVTFTKHDRRGWVIQLPTSEQLDLTEVGL
jgi:hypothetical protein